MDVPLQVLNHRLQVVHYNGGDVSADDDGVELALQLDQEIHETREGTGFDLVVDVKDAQTNPIAITHIVVMGPSGCMCPLRTMAVWWGNGAAKVRRVLDEWPWVDGVV